MKARLKPADGALLCLEPPTQVGGKQTNCRLKPARESAESVMVSNRGVDALKA